MMKKVLKNAISLDNNIKIYVPSTVNVSDSADTSIYVDETMMLLGKCFGGATGHLALGCWVSAGGQLIKERVTIVEAYCDSYALDGHIDNVYEFCLKLKRELGQEAIALEINGVLHLI